MKSYVSSPEGFNVRLEARVKNAALIRARENLGLKSNALAKEIGIPYNCYLSYEAMKSYPPREKQEKICEFYRNKGIFLLEEDVFPEELKQISPKKYFVEREIPRSQLISLNGISQRLLPYAKESVEKSANEHEMDDELNKVLKSLTEREEKVIKYRFGLYGEEPKTLDEVGQIFNVSRDRIRQIEAKALRKLRVPNRARILRHQMTDRDTE